MTEAPQLTTYQVASDDPQYAGATYVLDELDGDLLVYLEYADGSVLDAGLIYTSSWRGSVPDTSTASTSATGSFVRSRMCRFLTFWRAYRRTRPGRPRANLRRRSRPSRRRS